MRLAALLTCHNRREKTLNCLRALYSCTLPTNYELAVYLVDDGSQDGTAEAVRSEFPQIIVIEGNGSLFWNGGMRNAFSAAIIDGHDAYLWLNDDTILYPEALENLFSCSSHVADNHNSRSNIVVGATCDAITGKLTYGGLTSRSRWSPRYFVHLPVSNDPQPCKTLNGNCVLIPAKIVQTVGNIDNAYIHAIGDWDYGFRAKKAGFGIWMAPGFVGTCSQNPPEIVSHVEAANIRSQLRKACGPKRVPPGPWKIFVRRHYGLFWPAYFIRPYFSVVLRGLHAKIYCALKRVQDLA